MRLVLALTLCGCLFFGSAPVAGQTVGRVERLLHDPYPLEIQISFPAALLHWMDSIAGSTGVGLTAGKTREAHQHQFRRILGEPTNLDQHMLRKFMDVRLRAIAANPADPDAFTRAFFDNTSMQQVVDAAGALVNAEDRADMELALHHFVPRYTKIWNDGRLAKVFLSRARRSSKKKALAAFLHDVARFFEVSTTEEDSPVPRILLAPVIDGYGTHAQAIGRHLLIEVRARENLMDEVGPIVHENVHFLMRRMEPQKVAAFIDMAREMGPGGIDAWSVLREAIPTAIGQGVAEQRFRGDRWSLRSRWYDVDAVDRSAKRLYPAIRAAIDNGKTLDEAFFRLALGTIAE